ncbi:MAG TPA: beta-ketoacyl synthase N-terminal-like domain-containing protein [Polyangiaceae bacterium]|nr:beta-ketoacyl synthase N-terminal-like domain-containing protein [Polyangiaceae bacterium]
MKAAGRSLVVPDPLAIVGVGCRVRGVSGPDELWSVLRRGQDLVGPVPRRWWGDVYDPDPFAKGKSVSRFGSFLEDVQGIDWRFFGISPREARSMDPQHRLLLEVAWEALEDAGIPTSRAAGSRAGVFVGIMLNDYGRLYGRKLGAIDGYTIQNNTFAYAANRISFFFDLRGPSMAIDALCSSSLLAVHQACRSVWSGESEWALAGGVSLILAPDTDISMSKTTALSPTGRVRTWDAKADGYVRGEGAGLVIVKPLASALADGDRIYSLILGTAANHKGRGNWIVEPSSAAQRDAILTACATAGIGPEAIDYVELHGTGTPKGDPIEAEGLGDVMAERPADRPCAVGSIKTNLGHLDAAAGVLGLIKTALCVHRRELVPSLHFETCNPAIDLERLKLRVQTSVEPWPRHDALPVAGVTSVAFGGTNVHAVLGGIVPPPASAELEGNYVLPLSAKSHAALSSLAERYADWLDQGGSTRQPIGDVCYTVAARRAHHGHRLAVAGHSSVDIGRKLRSLLQGDPGAGARGARQHDKAPRVVFVFPGQGPQWLGMARDLLNENRVFAEMVAKCEALVRKHAGWSVVDAVLASPERSRLDEPEVVQPVLFSVELALVALWRSWGIVPDAVVGHSFGEIGAAVASGAIELEEGARIVCARGRVTQRRAGLGGIAAVDLSSDAVRKWLQPYRTLEIGGENTATSTIVTGDLRELGELLADLASHEVFARQVNAGYASHGRDMDSVLEDFSAQIGSMKGRDVPIAFYSTVFGCAVEGSALGTDHWVRNLRNPVRFADAMQSIGHAEPSVFIEISPHPVLSTSIRQNLDGSENVLAVVPSLRRGKASLPALDESLASLYAAGCDPAWAERYPSGHVVSTPTYSWQRERMWLETGGAESVEERSEPTHPLLGEPVDPPGAHTLVWEQTLGNAETGYFQDHCIQGIASLSTSAMVEMMVSAASRTLATEALEIVDLELRRAFLLPREGKYIVQTVLTRGEEWGAEVRGRSPAPGSPWRTHATARVRPASSIPPEAPSFAVPLANRLPTETAYRELDGLGLQYGPAFQGIEWLSRAGNGVLACIRMPDGLDARPYFFHPALHDAAMHAVVLAEPCRGHSGFVPVRIRRIWIHSRPRGVLRTHAVVTRQGAGMFADLRVENVNPGEVVEIVEGIELAHLDDAIVLGDVTSEEASWLYSVEWTALQRPELQPAPAPPTNQVAAERRRWLILADRQGVGTALAEQARQSGCDAIVLTLDAFHAGSLQSLPRSHDAGDALRRAIASALAPGGSLAGVVHLWSLDLPEVEAIDPRSVDEAMGVSCGSAVHLLQVLEDALPTRPSQVWYVTCGGEPWALKPSQMAPLQAPLWGLARATAAELPPRWGGLVDLDPAASAARNGAMLWAWLDGRRYGEDEVLFRNDAVFAGRLVRRSSQERQRSVDFRADASYLITGGTGGLGLAVARWLATRGVKHLLLAARTPLPPREQWAGVTGTSNQVEIIAALREIEGLGTTVRVVSLDVADQAAVIKCINAHERERLPPIRGIFHLAGTVHIDDVLKMDAGTLLEALRPKVHGTLALHRWVDDLDFFVLFSSASSIVRSPRLGHYAAGNAFLDAMAHYRRARGQTGIAIDWGLWRDVGFIRSLGNRGPGAMLGMKSMAPEAGIRVLEHLIASPDVQTVVWPADWEEWARLYPSFSQTSFISHLTGPPAAERTENSRTTIRSVLADVPEDRKATAVREHVALEIARHLRLPAASLAPDIPLEQLGFDSLIATELQAKLLAELGVRIPIMRLLGFSSVNTIADEVIALLENDSTSGSQYPPVAASDTRVRAAPRAADAPSPLDTDDGNDDFGRLGS